MDLLETHWRFPDSGDVKAPSHLSIQKWVPCCTHVVSGMQHERRNTSTNLFDAWLKDATDTQVVRIVILNKEIAGCVLDSDANYYGSKLVHSRRSRRIQLSSLSNLSRTLIRAWPSSFAPLPSGPMPQKESLSESWNMFIQWTLSRKYKDIPAPRLVRRRQFPTTPYLNDCSGWTCTKELCPSE